jgi:hypothetical protein
LFLLHRQQWRRHFLGPHSKNLRHVHRAKALSVFSQSLSVSQRHRFVVLRAVLRHLVSVLARVFPVPGSLLLLSLWLRRLLVLFALGAHLVCIPVAPCFCSSAVLVASGLAYVGLAALANALRPGLGALVGCVLRQRLHLAAPRACFFGFFHHG